MYVCIKNTRRGKENSPRKEEKREAQGKAGGDHEQRAGFGSLAFGEWSLGCQMESLRGSPCSVRRVWSMSDCRGLLRMWVLSQNRNFSLHSDSQGIRTYHGFSEQCAWYEEHDNWRHERISNTINKMDLWQARVKKKERRVKQNTKWKGRQKYRYKEIFLTIKEY